MCKLISEDYQCNRQCNQYRCKYGHESSEPNNPTAVRLGNLGNANLQSCSSEMSCMRGNCRRPNELKNLSWRARGVEKPLLLSRAIARLRHFLWGIGHKTSNDEN